MLLQQNKGNTNADSGLIDSLKLIMASSGLLLNLINNLLDVKKVDSKSKLFSPYQYLCLAVLYSIMRTPFYCTQKGWMILTVTC